MSIPARNEQLDSFMNRGQPLHDSTADFKVIVCIDMDAFYAAAEAVRYGYDETVPVVVVQWSGCIAVSYAARKHGVGRFMKIDEIKKVCPNVVFIHVDTIKLGQPYIDPYKRDLKEKLILGRDRDKEKVSLDYFRFESDKVISIFRKHCSVVEKASIDESFFDLTDEVNEIYKSNNYPKAWESKVAGSGEEGYQPQTKQDILLMIGAQITDKIRKEVTATLKYTCSAGVSYNKMLAKLASGLNKPNAQTVIVNKFVEQALMPVEIQKLRNFGGKIAEAFNKANLKTLGDMHKLSLEEVYGIVKDEHCAKWVYFRCRGYDDEVVEEKDFTNKSLLSNKSFDRAVTNMLDMENVVDLVLSDLCSRMVRFYRETNMVPGTLNLHYWDNKTHERRTKSGPVNLKVKEDKFFDVLKAKTQDLAKLVASVLFPCKFLGVSAKGFEKNDMKSYGFDLLTYAREKQKQKELQKANEAAALLELERQKENEEEFNQLMGREMEHLKEKLDESVDIGNSNIGYVFDRKEGEEAENFEELVRKDSSEICSGNLLAEKQSQQQHQQPILQFQQQQQQQITPAPEKIEEEVKVERIECEQCGQMVPKPELTDHYDFHIAQNLDKELNPNKRKYRKADSGQIIANFEGKEVPQEQVPKVLESRTAETSKAKPPTDGPAKQNKKANEKEKKVVSMKSLDTFFKKK